MKAPRDLDELAVNNSTKTLLKPRYHGDRTCAGWDTETADGMVFLVIRCIDGEAEFLGDPDRTLLFAEILDFMTVYRARSSTLNMFYNLGFDAQAILSLLTKPQLIRLHVETTIQAYGYHITYFPKKCLMLDRRDSEGNLVNSYKFFDLAQFCYTSLDGASKEWLGRPGKTEGIDVSRFGLNQDGEPNRYIQDRWDQIVEYGLSDARTAHDIALTVRNEAEELEIPFGTPYSTGYVGAETMRVRLDRKPQWGLKAIQQMGWKAYRGGRFEIYKRGTFENVVGYDINSAYPSILKDLPDPSTCHQRVIREPTVEDLRTADYGFVRARVSTADVPIQPFAIMQKKVIYPRLKTYEITVLIDEFLYALDAGLLDDFTLLKAGVLTECSQTRFPFQWIQNLYAQRKRYEIQGKDKKAKLIKIALNSMYGKLCQTQVERHLIETKDERESWGGKLTEYMGYLVGEKWKTGRFFNPVLASYVTGRTRLNLLKTVYDAGIEDDCIMLATDCIMVEDTARDSLSDAIAGGNKLGQWSLEYEGKALVVGSGVYQVVKNGETVKQKTRGFRELNNANLWNLARGSANGSISIQDLKPYSYMQAIIEGKSLSNVAKFMDYNRTLTADFDDKRLWTVHAPGFDDLLDGSHDSKPLLLEGTQEPPEGFYLLDTGRTVHVMKDDASLCWNNVNLDSGTIVEYPEEKLCGHCTVRVNQHDPRGTIWRELHEGT